MLDESPERRCVCLSFCLSAVYLFSDKVIVDYRYVSYEAISLFVFTQQLIFHRLSVFRLPPHNPISVLDLAKTGEFRRKLASSGN